MISGIPSLSGLSNDARPNRENAGVKKIINEARSEKLSHRDAAKLLSPIVGHRVSHATIGKFLRRKVSGLFIRNYQHT
ncbi:hypothetical protein L596_022527 [Steinernema carpocapsae]|uniref:Uncharacterized protein n=1 Tax=Steinernema carpocapsae TaxID=34508 RepID=A0A4V6A086_STECR|nr:hypothetical protein L596_022527 [Steinernema carpocapsae]